MARERGAGRKNAGASLFSNGDFTFWIQIQTGEKAGDVDQVADEPAHRPGKFLDERRGRDDLVGPGHFRLLVDVDHLQLAATLELRFAQLADAQDGLA